MQPLSPEYLAEIGRQLATVSAFLGGFAATFLGTLLGIDSRHRAVGWAAGSAAVSAAAFSVAVVASTMLAIVLHPSAPDVAVRTAHTIAARGVAVLGFFVGMYALLASLGLSGWLRSPALGRVTSTAAIVAAALATWATVSI